MMSSSDEKFMKRAIELAQKGEGCVEPNPVVGAVIVKNDKIISEGYHSYFGGPHAEINALTNAVESVQGADIYVTLEPCAHFGKTPPCADAIIEAKLKRVIIPFKDPNPITSGQGIEKLQNAGIEVVRGVCSQEAFLINIPFLKRHALGVPFFVAKWAMTLDGKIATYSGDSKWITSDEARQLAKNMRKKYGNVMVGIGTVIKDDPLLASSANLEEPQPCRIILDSSLKIPMDSQIVNTAEKIETIIATSMNANDEKMKLLLDKGCKILQIEEEFGKLNLQKLSEKLLELNKYRVFVEGGSTLLTELFNYSLVDRVAVFVGPKIIGGADSLPPVAGTGVDLIANAKKVDNIKMTSIGNNVLIEGDITNEWLQWK